MGLEALGAVIGITTAVGGLLFAAWNIGLRIREARKAGPHFTAAWSGSTAQYAALRISNGPHHTTLLQIGIGKVKKRPLRKFQSPGNNVHSLIHAGPIDIEPGRTMIYELLPPTQGDPLPFSPDLSDVSVWVLDGRTNKVVLVPREPVNSGWGPRAEIPTPRGTS